MVDLETLGRSPGCVILSIGAVAFDEITGTTGDEFYTVISRASCRAAGMFEDPETVAWWEEQTIEARAALVQATNTAGPTLAEALLAFTQFLQEGDEVWGNGADFDNAFLSTAFGLVGLETPWKFWNSRCYRTLKNLRPDVALDRTGTYHNALDDARTQAVHAIALLRALPAPLEAADVA